MAPLPTQASKLENCGVKAGYGYAFHDHGKPCPNRPFPGKGNGIANFPAVTGATASQTNGHAGTVTNDNSQSDRASGESSKSKGHGHGKALGHGRGNSD